MILVLVCAFAQLGLAAFGITIVILIGIFTVANLRFAHITNVIFVLILAGAKQRFTFIANMILGINIVAFFKLCSAVVAKVILSSIGMLTDDRRTVIALVILGVYVYMILRKIDLDGEIRHNLFAVDSYNNFSIFTNSFSKQLIIFEQCGDRTTCYTPFENNPQFIFLPMDRRQATFIGKGPGSADIFNRNLEIHTRAAFAVEPILEGMIFSIAILAAAVDTLVGVSTILAVGIISDFAGVIML